jgi:beta-lactamase superfamily II metal-dependent hydrolase
MGDYFEIDFLGVETAKSGDAITLRYCVDEQKTVHIVDGGYIDTGLQIQEHVSNFYDGTTYIDHVVLTHPDQDHANGLRFILENYTVGTLWMHRPWLYASEIIHRFETYNSVNALINELKRNYAAVAELERIAEEREILILDPFQGASIGAFTVLAPTKSRYLDLVVNSNKTPQAIQENSVDSVMGVFSSVFKAARNFFAAIWGEESFPASGTSNENEMSVVQYAYLNSKHILLTGDAGRDALAEAANYAPYVGWTLPGVDFIQVPHHGGRHNVSTEILDRIIGPRLSENPSTYTCAAICSSAKADEDHPRKVVVRAFIHRGAHFAATEGSTVSYCIGMSRSGWSPLPQSEYPMEMEVV